MMTWVIRRAVAAATAILTLLPIAAVGASADGMSQVYVPETGTWDLITEDSQFAMISLVDGEENLIIQASVSAAMLEASSEAVWFFPIPARPEDSNITIVQAIAPLDGYFVDELARDAVNDQFLWVYGTQLYPLLALGLTSFTSSDGEGTMGSYEEYRGSPEELAEVAIYGHVEAFGLASEFVTANDSDAVDAYLEGRGLDLSAASLAVLDGYIGEDYSFVVSWIEDVAEFMSMSQPVYGSRGLVYRLGVCVSFPTERMYYPLKLTSVYGPREIPMVIEVVGRGIPVEFENEQEQAQVEFRHCVDQQYEVSSFNSWFFANELRARDLGTGNHVLSDVDFTIITMEGSASDLTEDLWIDPGLDLRGSATIFVYHNTWTVVLSALIASSVLASLCSGLIVYWSLKPDLKLFAALGLANVLTLAGVIVATRVFDIDRNFASPDPKAPGFKRRGVFLLMFTLTFLGFAFLSNGIVLHMMY